MNRKKIEKKISDSYTAATPQIYNQIQNDVDGITVNRVSAPKSVRRTSTFWKLATGLLALLLVVTAVVGVADKVGQTASASTISLDVNPSVNIVLNHRNRVVRVEHLNDDGKTIIGDMDFTNCQLQVTVNALIGSMLRNGYLNELANSVLVSVDSNKNNYKTLADAVANEITVTLGQMSIDASVVSQWIQNSDEASALAKKYNMSLGKAQLICKIAASSEMYTTDSLAELTVNELSLILANVSASLDDVTQSGSASDKSYIGEEAAKEIAFKQLSAEGLTGALAYKCKLDFEDGAIVYDIEFVYGSYEYEFEIGAISGKIISFEREIADYRPDNSQAKLSQEEIKTVALNEASVAQEDAADVDVNLERCRYWLSTVYSVWFEYDGTYYEYEIDCYGTVLYANSQSIAGDEDGYLTRREVVDYFLKDGGNNFTQLDSLEKLCITSKTVDSQLIYELSFTYGNQAYKYEINAVTGVINFVNVSDADVKDKFNGMFDLDDEWWNSIIGEDWDFDDDDFEWKFEYGGHRYEFEFDIWGNIISGSQKPIDKPAQNNYARIDENEAKDIALRHAGVSKDKVSGLTISIDQDHGIYIYEVEFYYNGVEYEYELNAITGTIIKCERERDKR